MTRAPGFPLFDYLARAFLGSADDQVFCQEPDCNAFELLERLAVLAPAGVLRPLETVWDGDADSLDVTVLVAGKLDRLRFPTARYPLGLSDREALARFVEDVDALLATHGVALRVEVRATGPREARMMLTPASGEPARLPDRDEILPPERVVVTDVESVGDPSDYVDLLARMAARSDGALRYDAATCQRDGAGRRMTITRGPHVRSFELDGRGQIDPRFLVEVDRIIALDRTLHCLVQLASDDQCLHLAIVTAAEEQALAAAFLLAPDHER